MTDPIVVVYVSEQTSSRRPSIRMTCSCGWSVVACHGGDTIELTMLVDRALEHTERSHGIDELRGQCPVRVQRE
jgi:predicted small metal-binding protein